MIKKGFMLVFYALLVSGVCSGQDFFYDFSQGGDFMDLFGEQKFTHFETTHLGNEITMADEGVLFYSQGMDSEVVSKSLLERAGFSLRAGDSVQVTAELKIPSGSSLDYLFLLDLECARCWPEDGTKNPHVGVRLVVVDGAIKIDRGKIGYRKSPFRSLLGASPVPVGQWTTLEWHLNLSSTEEGRTQVWLGGELVLDSFGANLPNKTHILKKFGVRLQDEMIDKVELGATANSGLVPASVVFKSIHVKGL